MKRKIVFSILAIGWMGLIFWFSSKTATDSTEQSIFITEKFFRMFMDNPSREFLAAAESIIRKIAHFTEYFILAGFVFGAVYPCGTEGIFESCNTRKQ